VVFFKAGNKVGVGGVVDVRSAHHLTLSISPCIVDWSLNVWDHSSVLTLLTRSGLDLSLWQS
jgi:hypothetical protein